MSSTEIEAGAGLSPLVRRCANQLCELLEDQAVGAALPGEARLSELLGVSRTPLRRVLARSAHGRMRTAFPHGRRRRNGARCRAATRRPATIMMW